MVPAAQATIIGPRKELTAFINCPSVSVPVNCFGDTTFVTSGFKATCRMVLPMPTSEKVTSMVAKL